MLVLLVGCQVSKDEQSKDDTVTYDTDKSTEPTTGADEPPEFPEFDAAEIDELGVVIDES